MAIIRNGMPTQGVKRLGERSAPAPAVMAEAAPSATAVRASLQAAFADELEDLRAAARREGLLTAEAEIEGAVQRRLETLERDAAAAEARRERDHGDACASLREAIGAVRAQAGELRAEAEAAALEVAYQAVLRLLGAEMADRGLLVPLVAQAVREHRLSGPLTLTVSEAMAEQLQEIAVADVSLVVRGDATLARDACRIAFGEGRIEADLGVQLARLRDSFLEGLER